MLQPFMFQEACHLGQWGFMPGIQLFLKLCLGTCWDPLSIRNGVGVESIRHSFLYIPQQSYSRQFSSSEPWLISSGLKAVGVRACNYVPHFFPPLKTSREHGKLAELLQRLGM